MMEIKMGQLVRDKFKTGSKSWQCRHQGFTPIKSAVRLKNFNKRHVHEALYSCTENTNRMCINCTSEKKIPCTYVYLHCLFCINIMGNSS